MKRQFSAVPKHAHKRVNMITPHLFGRLPDPERMSKASVDDIFCSHAAHFIKFNSMSQDLEHNLATSTCIEKYV